MLNFVKNTFATVGVINTVYFLKKLVDDYVNSKSDQELFNEKMEKIDEKIQYIESVANRIEHIQYTLSELKNIIGTNVEDEVALNQLKKANHDFTDEIFY